MSELPEKPKDVIMAEISAAFDLRAPPDLISRINAISEASGGGFWNVLDDQVTSTLREWDEEDFEAAFRSIAGDLVSYAALLIRALKHRLGEELSPAQFAAY